MAFRKLPCIVILFFTGLLHVQVQCQLSAVKPLNIGEIRTIHSKALNEDRVLNIYLPEKFDTAKSYPVIYVLDGTLNEDFLHITGLVQFFNLTFKMPEYIIVGIANVDRKRDFTHRTNLKEFQEKVPTGGHSEPFIQFLSDELQPYIQSTYKTAGDRYLIGQSLGGLLATEVLLKKPQLFTHYLIVSPSLWWDDENLLKSAADYIKKAPDQERFVYVSVGKYEEKFMIRTAKTLYTLLQNAHKKNLKATFKLMKDDNHATILHRSLYEALLLLFPYGK